MIICWSTHAWEDYLHWQKVDKKTLNRINRLIKEISRNHYEGLGDPEPLKHNWSGFWSRRIDREHRIVYRVDGDRLYIAQCRYHY